jgi:hypothetical protein
VRPLAIVCETSQAERVARIVERHCHPALRQTFVRVFGIDVDAAKAGSDAEKLQVLDWVRTSPAGATDTPLLCCSHAAGAAITARSLAALMRLELVSYGAGALTQETNSQGPVPVQRLLNQCSLSLLSASAAMLGHWNHGKVDRAQINAWVEQFGRLGPYRWVADAILKDLCLVEAAQLGDMLESLGLDNSAALAVNRDPRGNAKSAEIVQNLLGKRRADTTIFSSPKQAFEQLGKSVIIFEDGLWSGTEAIGIIESLSGERSASALKTDPLVDASVLQTRGVTFAYGIATDYGTQVLRRFLADRGLTNVQVTSARELRVCTDALTLRLQEPSCDVRQLRELGPDRGEIVPTLFQAFERSGANGSEVSQAKYFLAHVGEQLFGHYIVHMQKTKGWTAWPSPKLKMASLGMHGLALTHTFCHSSPRAALPVLWAEGPVTVGTKKVEWKPLFPNAY